MVDSAGEDESDDALMYLNRRKAAKKRNRRRLLGGLRRRGAVGAGTREKPVLLDLEVDEDESGSGGEAEKERGVREGSKFRGRNGGEEMRAIEGSGYQEVGAAGAAGGGYQEVGAAGIEGGAADGIEVLLGVQGSQTQGRS